MKKEIEAYLRNESLEDLQRILDTGVTEDEFYQYVGVVQIYEDFSDLEQHNLRVDERVPHILELVAHEWGKCVTSTGVEYARTMIERLPSINDEQQKHRCMLFNNCYRILYMHHTQEHTLDEWVNQLYWYCEEIRENGLVGYGNIDDMFFYTQEEFEEKFYRVTGVCISNLEERTRQQLYNELGRVLTRGGNEAKIKHIIGKIL